MAFGLIAAFALYGGQASADIIYESATLGTTGLNVGGWGLWDTQYLGSRFTVNTETVVTSISGHMEGEGTLFGAIVKLSGPGALPVGSPFTGSELLASGTFTASEPSSEQTLAMLVTLAPGDYGVIFGTGLFGATGLGGMPQASDTGSVDIGSASYFFWFGDPTGPSWQDGGFNAVRFVVNGETESVPEPSTFLLLGAGLGGLALLRRRKQ